MHCIELYSRHDSIIWPVSLNGWVFVYKLSSCGFECSCLNARFPALSNKEFLDIQTTIEYRFTLKGVPGMITTYSEMYGTNNYSQHSSIIWAVWLMVECLFTDLFVVGLSPVAVISATDFVAVSRKEFLCLQSTTECGFTLKLVQTMTRRYSEMHRTDKCSQHSSVIWQVWLNGWVFAYKLSGCGFVSSCSHLNFRFTAWFKQEVHWYSGN